MALTAGGKLGPYEILSPIGSGGMGEVYRAKDTRLGREVALKVLSENLAGSGEARERFAREARAVAALSHPNIVALFDVGEEGGVFYAVSEFLEGQTLRDRLSEGPLALRRTLDIAVQVARGLAAAHEKGICHRDIKPENLFLTRDGQVKILDFGLARLDTGFAGPVDLESPTVSKTAPGRLLGTVGYMSPEQARGRAADTRSDIFSFGAVLYEMVSGRRAFSGESAVETLGAILKNDPVPLEELAPGAPPALDRLVMRCLEKDAAARFQSARDLAFSLEAWLGVSTGGAEKIQAVTVRARTRAAFLWPALAALCLLAALASGWVALKGGEKREIPEFQRITFRQGAIRHARFGPSGRNAICSAAWNGPAMEIYAVGLEGGDAVPLELKATLLAISKQSELAVQLSPARWNSFMVGMLARVSGGGTAPRDVMENVQEADWGPDGKDLAVLRQTPASHWVVEFPLGKTLLDTVRPMTGLRVSPDGKWLALMEGENLILLDRSGTKKSIAEIKAFHGLAWSADGSTIRFAAGEPGGETGLWTVTTTGRKRLLYRAAGAIRFHDSSPAGDLLGFVNFHHEVMVRPPGATTEQDLSWLDGSLAVDLSSDGQTLLLNERGVAAGPSGAFYLRRVDGSPPVKLGEGRAYDLSADGTLVLASPAGRPNAPALTIVPTGAGRAAAVPLQGMDRLLDAWFFPDGKRLLLHGAAPGKEERFFIIGLEGGVPKPLTPEGTTYFDGQKPISPDGKMVCAVSGIIGDVKASLFPVDGGEPRSLPGYQQGDVLADWSGDGRYIFAFRRDQIPAPVVRIEVATGKREPWRELSPSDTAGALGISRILLTPDGSTVAYSYTRSLEDLYLAKGLK